jgi:hypothetical protein
MSKAKCQTKPECQGPNEKWDKQSVIGREISNSPCPPLAPRGGTVSSMPRPDLTMTQ